MRTVDRVIVNAPIERVFQAASEVERWPEFLAHYRWVRVLEVRPRGGTVEMSAWRNFGPLKYPTWWISEMEVLPAENAIRYRHVRGITRGMDVEWSLDLVKPVPDRQTPAQSAAVQVRIVHQWDGPSWPAVGPWAARAVIGPVFIHHIASRTLAGIKRRVEAS